MSRPPNTPDHLSSAYNNRGGIIDFVNMPVALGNPYGMPYSDEVYNQPSIYAQAGFPGYASSQALSQNYQTYPMGMYQPLASPAYLPTLPMHELSAPVTTPVVAPVESEDSLRLRINDKINDIIQTQKQNMLQSKIESLQNKVEQLSQNMGSSMGSSMGSGMGSSMGHQSNLDEEFALNPHLNRLSDKVEKLSQTISLSQGFSQHSPNDNTYNSMDQRLGSPYAKHSEPDVEISRRLRRLAEESASRAADTHRHEERNNKIPDW